jgi:D-serine dehydratase
MRYDRNNASATLAHCCRHADGSVGCDIHHPMVTVCCGMHNGPGGIIIGDHLKFGSRKGIDWYDG